MNESVAISTPPASSREPVATPIGNGATARTSPLSGKSGEIFEALERRLATGRYKFGEPLSAVDLAVEFAASRQPVSVALNHLRSLGYVVITPQVGCKVVAPTQTDISDFFYMLAKIESAVAGLAAQRHLDAELSELASVADRIEAGPRDIAATRAYADLVDVFHELLSRMARSAMLSFQLGTLWKMSDFLMWQGMPNLTNEAIKEACSERRSIIAAIAARNVRLAEAEMEAHVLGKPRRVGIV